MSGVVNASGVVARDPVKHPGRRLNNYYMAASVLPSSATATIVADTLYLQPIALVGTFNRIGIEVTTGAAGEARLGLYHNNNGIPGTLFMDLGTVDTTNIAIVQLTIADLVLTGEWLWMGVVSNATPTCRCGTVGWAMITGSSTPSAGIRGYAGNHTYGALPATAPSLSVSSVGPAIFMRGV